MTSLRSLALLAALLGLAACKESPKKAATPPAVTPTPAPVASSPQPVAGDRAPALVAAPKYDVKDPLNARIRQDVLERVDRLPNLSSEQRNKLYASVDRARGMGCVLIVPFLEGKRVLADAERKVLVNGIRSEAVQKLIDDPSLVFVILGYANEGTDEGEQIKLAGERAESVHATMRDLANVTNTIYPAGMGVSDAKQKAAPGAGRVAEIWAVFP